MKQLSFAFTFLLCSLACLSQNVGIGTVSPTERLHVVGNRVLLDVNYVGIGVGNPVTGSSFFQINNPINSYVGMYCNSGPTGLPFYGYALNGIATAYHQYNPVSSQFEYYHSNSGAPDFIIGNTKASFPNSNFLGVGTNSPTNSFSGFSVKSSVNSYWGSYVDAGATGLPFYGYALNGVATAYHMYNSGTSQFEYHHTSDAVPDFQIGTTTAAFPNTAFLGIGTVTPTTGFTGLALKSNVNTFFGSYIDAGPTGVPFYGYALNGTARAYASFNGPNNSYEYHQTSDVIPDFLINGNVKAVFNTAFVGIGTSIPTTAFTGFAMKSSANTFYGSYVDAGPTGIPFYGYALNGTARSYAAFNGANNAYEYHQSSDAIADFSVNGNTKAVFNTAFVGIGTSTPTTGFTGFTMKSAANTFYGSYVDAGPTGLPFYGYALGGIAQAYTTFNGNTSQFEYHHTSDATPDFAVNNTQVLFPIQSFLGLGTTIPTTGVATGFTMKKNVNGFYGMYIDAGATGEPFYGYALNGSAVGWTEVNGNTNNWELHYGGTSISVTTSGFVGMGTGSPAQRLDVAGNIRCVSLTQTSDVRFKENIEPLEESLDKIKRLQGVTWKWKTKEYPERDFSEEKQIGFVAQEVEKIIPEVVFTDKQGYKSIDYAKMTAVLTEAVKDQQAQIAELKKQVQELLNAKK